MKTRRSITWQEAVQLAQACELPRASDRSSSLAAIANDASSATYANSAQSSKTTSNNCAITTPCAPGNLRRHHKYSSGSHAPQGNWRAAIPDNAVDPPSYLWNFDPITGAPRSTPPNTQTQNLSNISCEYQRAPFAAQQIPVFENLMQPRPNQHTPRPQFQQPRGQRAPFTSLQANSYAAPPRMDTFANHLPLMYKQQQPPPQQTNRLSSNVHAVESEGHDAPQAFAAVKLNGILIEGALIDSGSAFSIIASSTLSALPERPSVEHFMHRPPNIFGVGGSSEKFWATSTFRSSSPMSRCDTR